MTLTATTSAVAMPPGVGKGAGRLRRPDDVRRALRRGRSRAGSQMAVHVLERPEGEEPGTRLTVVASRRVGGAVQRNRAKRLLREAARARRWRGGLDVVLIARERCARSNVHRVGRELTELAERLGALEAPEDAR